MTKSGFVGMLAPKLVSVHVPAPAMVSLYSSMHDAFLNLQPQVTLSRAWHKTDAEGSAISPPLRR